MSRLLPTLWVISAALTALILGPLLRPGYLLYRDAVSTPRSYVTDTTLGIGDLPPRAVPQDWAVALGSLVVDGGFLVTAILFAALTVGGVGYGRLAARLVPGAGRTGAVAATIVSLWNPFVAERLLQGHWGLLVGYGALGWIALAAARYGFAQSGFSTSLRRWFVLAALLAVAGFTPSGSLFGLVVAVVCVLGGGGVFAGGGSRGAQPSVCVCTRRVAGVLAAWVLSALPWLVAALLTSASTSTDGSAGVRAFGLRSEPALGPLGTVLGLGGIWNADAAPASRTFWWAAVATVCLFAVVGVGSITLWRRRELLVDAPLVRALAVLGVVVVVVLAITAFGPGSSALAGIVDTVPGGGLLRDSSKFVALVMPIVAVACAAAVWRLRDLVPSGFALAAVILLVVAPLPDLAWGVGGRLSTVQYPDDWSRVAHLVPSDAGDVALWPPDTVRQYPFTDSPSLDPAARMLRAPVVESGELVVDGATVDEATPRAQQVTEALRTGGDPTTLTRLGVGWVLVENLSGTAQPDIPAALAGRADVVFRGHDLVLFRIDDPADVGGASGAARVTAYAAHLVWAALVICGAVAALWPRRRRRARGLPSRVQQ